MVQWTRVKDNLPPFYVFVEVIYGSQSIMNNLHRGFCCLCHDQEGEEKRIFWSKDGWDERENGDFEITHWREMAPDHLGRIPILITTRNDGFKIKMKKLPTTVME